MRLPLRRSPKPPATSADVQEFTLAAVQTEPEVAAALEEAPAVWRNCVFRDEATGQLEDLSLTRQELVDYVWLTAEDDYTWQLAFGDECFPLLDLDAEDDPVVAALREHADVVDAYHEDREVFVFSTARKLTAVEAAVLAVRALTAGHRRALRSAGLDA